MSVEQYAQRVPVGDYDGWYLTVIDPCAGTWTAEHPETGKTVDSTYSDVLVASFRETAAYAIQETHLAIAAAHLAPLIAASQTEWYLTEHSALLPASVGIRYDRSTSSTPARFRLVLHGDTWSDYDDPLLSCDWDDHDALARMVALVYQPDEAAVLFALDPAGRFANTFEEHRYATLPATQLPTLADLPAVLATVFPELEETRRGDPKTVMQWSPMPHANDKLIGYLVFKPTWQSDTTDLLAIAQTLETTLGWRTTVLYDESENTPDRIVVSTLGVSDHAFLSAYETDGDVTYTLGATKSFALRQA